MELKWFESYLIDRSQTTVINGKTSNKLENKSGVPQGSILGPLLFLIYMNDITNYIGVNNECCLNLFADDTSVSIKDIKSAISRLNKVLNKVITGCAQHELVLNTDKTKVMLLGVKDKSVILSNVTLHGHILQVVDNIKYLGVHIDKNLNFKHHTEELVSKLKQENNYFVRTSKSLNLKSRLDVYRCIRTSLEILSYYFDVYEQRRH